MLKLILIFSIIFPISSAAPSLSKGKGIHSTKACLPPDLERTPPEDWVNILGGTNSRYDLSHGSTLPLITRPWGFNGFAPQTDDDPTWPGWWFHPSDRRFFGLRLTHQPSPWIADYGNFLIKAYIPSRPADNTDSHDKFTGYTPNRSTFSPYYFQTELFNYGNTNGNVELEFSPSNHGGIMRAKFPKYIAHEVGDVGEIPADQNRRVSIDLPLSSDIAEVSKSPIDGTTMISGYTTKNSGGVGDAGADFKHYFVATIHSGLLGDEVTSFTSDSIKSNGASVWADFSPIDPRSQSLTIRIATSLISADQALTNLKSEVAGLGFDQLKLQAKEEWNSVLNRVKISAPPSDLDNCAASDLYTVFYSSLYRASLFPRLLNEVAEDGSIVHWSPYATESANRVRSGPLSTDSGFWDAWNTVYPLQTLVNRPQIATTMQGWLNAYSEGGWLPKWASPGYRGSMIGTMGDVSLADAIVKDIPGFDKELAYQAIRKDAFEVPPKGVDGIGRVCLDSYLKYGYVPVGAPMTTGGTCYEVVSRTLNYLQSDWAIAQAAQKLGHADDFAVLSQRASNYNKSFDADTGFFRSHDLVEKWTTPFDQFGWGGDYTEGGPWQYRFYVPYDPQGLAQVYKNSGRDMCQELKNTQEMEHSTVHLGSYGSIIHEQTEMADACWGQYAHNNQPSHYMLYMHLHDGYSGKCSTQGRYWIRKTLLDLYTADENMFAGDEDNGEMAAWFVLSSVGLYERSPGSGTFEFSAPLFGRVDIDISDIPHQGSQQGKRRAATSDAKTLTIITKNNSGENSYISRVLWNDAEIDHSQNGIAYSTLAEGGTLTFEMGPVPSSHK